MKKTCIDLLKTCKSTSHFKQIQAQIFTNNLHENTDILHKLISFTSKTSNPTYTHKIFTHISHPTLFIYNIMIKTHVKTHNFKHALHLFDEMRNRKISPDNYTYPFIFKAVTGLRWVLLGQKVHAFVLKNGGLYDCYVSNSVMDMYGEMGCLECLEKVFDEMPERDLVSWNVLISGFVKNRRFEEGVGVYRRMRREAGFLYPDESTVVSTLSGCAALRDLDLGREVYEYVRMGGIEFTMIVGNALVDMFGKCGCLDVARGIFDGMREKNVICWTSMVSAYVGCGCLDEARVLFERSPVRDLVLWTTMINGYVQFNRVDEAMVLFGEMQVDGVKPDKYTLVALLTGCAQLGALEQGQWIHSYLEENSIPIDAVVGTALIEMYAKCGLLEKSLEIFTHLKHKDAASWTSIICALAMNGNTTRALQLYSEMIEIGIKPDDITFIGVLSACSHGGLVEEGRRHFDSMSKIYQIEPKSEHYGCLIDLLGRFGLLHEAEEIITRIPNKDSKITIPLYGALLSACRNYENIDIGERIAKRLEEIECSESSSHTLLANIYASASRWEDVSRVRRKMAYVGAKKSPGCSAVEVNVNVH